MRGFYQGSLWGLILGGAGLSFASLVNELPDYAKGPPAPQLVAPELALAEPEIGITVTGADDRGPVFATAAPESLTFDGADAAPVVATEPAEPPKTVDIASAIDAPDETQDPELSAATDAPVTTQVETELAQALPEDDEVDVDTSSAAAEPVTDEPAATEPAQADAVADDSPEQPAVATTQDVTEPEVAPQETDFAETPADVTAPETLAVDTTPAVPEQDPAPSTVPDDATAEAAQEDNAPAVVEDTIAPSEDDAPTVTDTIQDTPEPAATAVARALPQVGTAVRINRPGATEETAPTEADKAAAPDLPDDAPALLRFAAPFENAQSAPLISILLIDTGDMPNAADELSTLGFTPTIAINSLSSSATAVAETYRDAGIEVALIADLPQGARPSDVEVSFGAALGLVPEVAMLFSDGTGAMQDRAVTAQVMQILADNGHGFVSVQRGLNNPARAAAQADVPAATVLRDIDGAGEDSRAILRALDQAAFRARQSGGAVLLGRVTPQTLDALRSWAERLDRETLMIAPVSAVLLAQ